MSEVVADNHDATLATNNFALIANLLHAWLNLHELPSFLYYVKNYLFSKQFLLRTTCNDKQSDLG